MRKHRSDRIITLATIILMLIGTIIIYSIGGRVAQAQNVARGKNFSEGYYILRYGAVVAMSLIAMFIAAKIPYKYLSKYAKKVFWGGAILCALVTIFAKMNLTNIVTCDLGACRAFYIPVVSMGFAPVEVLKIGILLYSAQLIRSRREAGKLETANFWVPFATMFLVTAVLVGWWQKDFGSTVVISAMMLAMLFAGKAKIQQILLAIGVLAFAAVILILTQQHRIDRIMGWEGSGNSYHKESSLMSLGTGGLLGVGLGNSVQSSGYLPESLTDSIFSIIGEVWGFMGAGLVIVTYAVLFWRILATSERTEDGEQSLFAVGVFAWLLSHVIINVGGMTGIIPMKGITLPFLSYGGTSMLFAAFAVGVVIQISGWTKRTKVNEDSSSRWGQRRTRDAGSRRSS
ncbi:FtsW/RodA/SpoVE family cell cycle protein [Candidatus Saccharibacteria bacterium]|nr:FtsW/RodA/SpoVE family cell cycle protein [Candidatus Saccharibacteria bacterium]